MKYVHESVSDSAAFVVKELQQNDGLGGVIALDEQGNVAFSMNSSGMYRGYIKHDGIPLAAIFADEDLH